MSIKTFVNLEKRKICLNNRQPNSVNSTDIRKLNYLTFETVLNRLKCFKIILVWHLAFVAGLGFIPVDICLIDTECTTGSGVIA